MKKSNEAFEKLKRDLKEGTVRCAYIFYGEESYLREYYLGALRKALEKRTRERYALRTQLTYSEGQEQETARDGAFLI